MRHMYEVAAQIEPLGVSNFPEHADGAYVYCYVPAESLLGSLDAAESFLNTSGYHVIDLTHSLRIDLDDYEPHDEHHPSIDDLRTAYFAGKSLFGPFYCYEYEDE